MLTKSSIFFNQTIIKKSLMKKQFFLINNFKKYKNINQYEFNMFIRECVDVFEIRKIIYVNNLNKNFFAQLYLEDIFVEK